MLFIYNIHTILNDGNHRQCYREVLITRSQLEIVQICTLYSKNVILLLKFIIQELFVLVTHFEFFFSISNFDFFLTI